MGSLVSDIVAHIYTQVNAILPNTYTKLNYVYNPAKEKLKGANKKYGVKPLAIDQNDMNIGAYGVNQDFQITLTNSYKKAKTLVNDQDQQDVSIELQDYCHDIFKRLKLTNGSTTIRQVFQLVIDTPEFDEDNSIVIQNMTITVKYQSSLN